MRYQWTHSLCAALCAAGLAFFAACGSPHNSGGEDYGNLLDNPLGLELTQQVHPIGWGKADCTECHSLANIHRVNRTSLDLDMEAIRGIVEQRGQASCAGCHGNNGVK